MSILSKAKKTITRNNSNTENRTEDESTIDEDDVMENEDELQGNQRYTDQELLDDLEIAAEQADGSLTIEEYREHGAHSVNTIYDRFESFNAAKEQAGLETSNTGGESRISDDQLLEELNEGKTGTEIAEDHDYNPDTYPSTISSRVTNNGWTLRNKLSVPSDPENHSVIMSLKQDEVREAGFDPEDDTVYFEKEVQDGQIVIKFSDERVNTGEAE